MQKTIVFIHGMFQNPKSWEQWANYFTQRGYNCIVPAWPDHEGEPAELRQNPPATLGDLRLSEVVVKMVSEVSALPEKPIVIGHSVGGLITQILANKNLIALGVPVSSVAPNAMLSFDWNFFKNSVTIANPFKGDEPIFQTVESFHDAFCNTLSDADAQAAFDATATHDSRNVLRDCMMEAGHVDLDLPHVPLLFLAGVEDHIIPYELVLRNSEAYTDDAGITAFKQFEGRSHYICGEPGWEEVAGYVANWIEAQK